ncbi:WD repeat-containing protein 6 [Pieris napi]|uniref:WD repeat-containing protein 6 n=1 Tax=Pieris napi TaxID=78633 RepID=UPI001FB9410B|nr:WD repeat-containing protein 6 [Pieris napi]
MSTFIRTDVTCVKFYQQFVLAGIGSVLHVFLRDVDKLKQTLSVLNGQKIYGIVPSKTDNKLIIFGGKQIAIVELDVEKDDFYCVFMPILCDDWVHSAVWKSSNIIAVLTAHNVVETWNTEFQMQCSQNKSIENSILYCGLLVNLLDDVLVLSGTVFSEVLLRFPDEETFYSLKGHKGVIFSITCDYKRGIIITTSDDRSVRIWKVQSQIEKTFDTKVSWTNVENIPCLHELYGHGARVMRNCIISDYVVSVGEDSAICYWDINGKLLRKVTSHTNSCIWSLDAEDNYLVTGGGDSAVIIHPLSVITEYNRNCLSLDLNIISPKKLAFTAQRNIVIMTDCNELIFYNANSNTKTEFKLNHETTYKLLSVSSCKQLIAVVDMSGKFDVFIENCKENVINNIIDTKLDVGKIMSMHWAGNRHLVFCAELGRITILTADNKIDIFATFNLPKCKERWLTAVAINRDNLIAGDRCGNIHIYVKGEMGPIKTFKHIHGRYGPTSIKILNNTDFITTGRDGCIKYFSLTRYLYSRDLDYPWVERFVDNNNKYVCGFQERTFIVYDIVHNIKVLEVQCGGGHRSWDVIRYIQKSNEDFNEFISFIYIKESNINSHTFQLNKIMSKSIFTGTHSKEINCLDSYKYPLDTSITYFVSGGEDTTLRITSLNSVNQLKEELIFRHLSSIRTVKLKELHDNSLLVVSAGGRAQICIRKILFKKIAGSVLVSGEELVNHMIKGTDKERTESRKRGCETDFDPETRVMDLEILSSDNVKFLIFVGCSDGKIRTLEFNLHNNEMNNVDYIEKGLCFLKMRLLELPARRMLICSTSHASLYIWDMPQLIKDYEQHYLIHKSGVNCIATAIISDTDFLMATGGDDNAVSLNYMSVEECVVVKKEVWTSETSHCSQVTGVLIVDNLLVSASIDQRVTVFEWSLLNGLKCEFRSQVFSDVADIQGIQLLQSDKSSLTVCVFGKGMEVMLIQRPPPQSH